MRRQGDDGRAKPGTEYWAGGVDISLPKMSQLAEAQSTVTVGTLLSATPRAYEPGLPILSSNSR